MLDDSLWKCPVCRGRLDDRGASLECPACHRAFDVVDGIPDFRLARPSWIDVVDDTKTARELSELKPLRQPADAPDEHMRLGREAEAVGSGQRHPAPDLDDAVDLLEVDFRVSDA